MAISNSKFVGILLGKATIAATHGAKRLLFFYLLARVVVTALEHGVFFS